MHFETLRGLSDRLPEPYLYWLNVLEWLETRFSFVDILSRFFSSLVYSERRPSLLAAPSGRWLREERGCLAFAVSGGRVQHITGDIREAFVLVRQRQPELSAQFRVLVLETLVFDLKSYRLFFSTRT